MRNTLLVILFSFFIFSALAQNIDENAPKSPINLSGVILDAENMEPVPYAYVLLDKGRRGTVADNTGYFSFLANPGDTIVFRSVGYQNRMFVIPDILDGNSYSMIELMVKDNVILDEVVVYPLPDIDVFAQTVLKKDLSTQQINDITKFKRSMNELLEQEYQKDKYYYDQWRYAKLYDITGLVPPNNFLNPITWSNFIRDWKENQN
jgi:hypothetical protein